jgi:DNA-binding Lrp family transcriptional regulator
MDAAAECSDTVVGTASDPAAIGKCRFSQLERRLIDEFQRGLPLTPRPYSTIAERFGVAEADVIRTLERQARRGTLSRVGAVVAPHRIGWSTLAAMAVPKARLNAVAALVDGYPELNHIYEREHEFNLWFVVTAAHRARIAAVLAQIARRTRLAVLDLPLEAAYHIDLGFPIQWN